MGYLNKKGQALAELAVFGSLLLFVLAILIEYGLFMNRQQQTDMWAFRRGLQIANANMASSMQAQYQVVEDKPIPNPQDPFGIPDLRPVSSSANITWSSGLMAALPSDFPTDLPHIYYEINGNTEDFTMACWYWATSDGQGNSGEGWRNIPWGSVSEGEFIDVDGDEFDERIVYVEDLGNHLEFAIIVDYQCGQINPDYAIHGLQQDYVSLRDLGEDTYIENSENWYQHTNVTQHDVTDTITRYVGYYPGQVGFEPGETDCGEDCWKLDQYEAQSEIKDTSRTEWVTDK